MGIVVPDSAVRPAELSLVKLRGAEGVDVGDDVIWILAVGSDARPGESMTRTRGDAIQMVGLNTRTGRGLGDRHRRATRGSRSPATAPTASTPALTFGGPSLMGRTVGNLVGVQPDYVMVTRFPFFENMINDIGGIYVDNPRPFSDPYLKPKAFKQGHIKLDGYSAMAFSRIRKSLAGGDFDRSANQQRVLRGIQSRIATRADEPGFIERGVVTVMRNMDTNLAPLGALRAGPGGGAGRPVARSGPASSAARSAPSAARASSSPTSPRPAATATPPAPTPPSAPADAPLREPSVVQASRALSRQLCRPAGR